MKLLKTSLSTSLYLHITIDNLSTVMTQKRSNFLYAYVRPVRGGGRHDHGYERHSGDFKLKEIFLFLVVI